MSGVGFLGAGVILRDSGRVIGLTTASTIWLAAALGMGIGGGQYVVAGAAAVAVSFVLWVFPGLESWIDNLRHTRTYEVVCPIGEDKFEELEKIFLKSGLRVIRGSRTKSGEDMVCKWETHGSPKEHKQLEEKLFAHADVKKFQ